MHLIRAATLADKPALELLIAHSARELSKGDYTPEQPCIVDDRMSRLR